MKRPPHRLVDEYEDRLQLVESEFHRAYWDSQIHASADNDKRRSELELRLRELKGDAATLAGVKEALEEGMHEPLLRRQLEVMRLSLTGNQMTAAQREELVELAGSVESEFAVYRPQCDGEELTENRITEILEDSDDQEFRKRTWLASKEIGHRVSGRVRELARLRNSVALELGYADYYGMALSLQEISEDWLFRLFGELDELTRAPFSQWKETTDAILAERFGTDDLQPWHYSDPFFQHPPRGSGIDLDPYFQDVSAADLAARTFARWGIDIGGVLHASDLFPRPLKCQHAFCLDVDRSGRDVRVLANVVPGERWVEIMLHESGHAAYDISIDKKLPYLLRRGAHTFVTEAIAILFGRLTRNPQWLVEIGGLPADEVQQMADDLRRSSAIQSILFARWVLVMSHFERDLYADPEADLDAKWWDLVERFQLLRPPKEEAPGAWASKIHIAAAPVYYHNYLLGELLASQLETTIVERAGDLIGNKAAGDLLINGLFRHGNKLRWDKTIEDAIGRPLSARAFATRISG